MISEPSFEEIERGETLFNAGRFFESHEWLEGLWMKSGGETKLFLQGLIQAAAGFHKLRQNHAKGGAELLRKSAAKLMKPSHWNGPAVRRFAGEILRCANHAEKGVLDWNMAPKMKIVPREGIEPTRPGRMKL